MASYGSKLRLRLCMLTLLHSILQTEKSMKSIKFFSGHSRNMEDLLVIAHVPMIDESQCASFSVVSIILQNISSNG